MCDGQRKITTKLTEAQYDIIKAAITETIQHWNQSTTQHKRNSHTLKRALTKLQQAWDTAPRT